MSTVINQVSNQNKRITLMSLTHPIAYRVRTDEYNNDTNKFEVSESYCSPNLIDCELEFNFQVFNLK